MTGSNSPAQVPNNHLPDLTRRAESELAIAQANRDPEALMRVHNQASALEKLVGEAARRSKTLGDNLRKLNNLAKVRIAAAREMGTILRDLVRKGGPRYRGRTLDELGVSRNQSSKWQKLAELPDMVDAYIESANNRAEEASIAGYSRFARNEPHFSSDSSEWYTPKEIVEACVKLFGSIDLDPCSNLGEPNVPAKSHFTANDDGLAQPWTGHVFMNPPYGRALKHWVRKFIREKERGHLVAGVALLPARPGSDWFDELSDLDLCFVRGRLRFSEGNPAPFPSMCAYQGPDRSRFLETFASIGCMYRPAVDTPEKSYDD